MGGRKNFDRKLHCVNKHSSNINLKKHRTKSNYYFIQLTHTITQRNSIPCSWLTTAEVFSINISASNKIFQSTEQIGAVLEEININNLIEKKKKSFINSLQLISMLFGLSIKRLRYSQYLEAEVVNNSTRVRDKQG